MSNGQNQPPIQRVTMTWSAAIRAGKDMYDRKLNEDNQSIERLLRDASLSNSRLLERDGIHEDGPQKIATIKATMKAPEYSRSYLQDLLAGTESTAENLVDVGSLVKILFGDEERWILIVPMAGGGIVSDKRLAEPLRLISIQSPIGECVYRTHVGDTVVLRNTKGSVRISILQILSGAEEKIPKKDESSSIN